MTISRTQYKTYCTIVSIAAKIQQISGLTSPITLILTGSQTGFSVLHA